MLIFEEKTMEGQLKKYLLLIVCIIPVLLIAQGTNEGIQTDRPGIGQSAYTLEKRSLQFELGGNYEWNNRINPNITEDLAYGEIYARYGLFKNLELRLSTSYLSDKDYLKNSNGSKTLSRMKGFIPFSIGIKSTILQERQFQPKTALLLSFGIPFAASSGFRLKHLTISCLVPMEWNLKENILLTSNIGGYTDGQTSRTYMFGSLSVDYSFLKKWTSFIEFYSSYNDKSKGQIAVDAGVVWKITSTFQLDVSYGYGISSNSPNGFVNAGASYMIRLKNEPESSVF